MSRALTEPHAPSAADIDMALLLVTSDAAAPGVIAYHSVAAALGVQEACLALLDRHRPRWSGIDHDAIRHNLAICAFLPLE